MRGRLHHKHTAEFAVLDARAIREEETASSPPVASGFDDDFKEVIVFSQAGTKRMSARLERTIYVKCNIEIDTEDALDQRAAGNSPNSKVVLVIHRKELERHALIDVDSGECKIRVNDRLNAVRDRCGHIVQKIRTPNGLYVTEVKPSYGIGSLPDLVLMTCEDREQFTR